MKKILIVDDSALMRRVLCDIINGDRRFQVADKAANGLIAEIHMMRLFWMSTCLKWAVLNF